MSTILFVPTQFCWTCQLVLISLFFTKFHFFWTGEIELITDLGFIDMFSTNHNAEIVAWKWLRSDIQTPLQSWFHLLQLDTLIMIWELYIINGHYVGESVNWQIHQVAGDSSCHFSISMCNTVLEISDF